MENSFFIRTEKDARTATIILAGDLGDMTGFGVEAKLVGPPGPGPASFDSTIASPSLRVVRDRFFVLLEVANPNPGEWQVIVRGRPGAGQFQTGNVTVLSDNPSVDLFTSLDRHFVKESPPKPIHLRATPIFGTTLRKVDVFRAVVKYPDGSLHPVDLASNFEAGGGEDYSAPDQGHAVRRHVRGAGGDADGSQRVQRSGRVDFRDGAFQQGGRASIGARLRGVLLRDQRPGGSGLSADESDGRSRGQEVRLSRCRADPRRRRAPARGAPVASNRPFLMPPLPRNLMIDNALVYH